jgi:hypothetical protein
MTHDIDYPYITNRRENDLGVVIDPPAGFIVPNQPVNTPNRNHVKCVDTEINMHVRVAKNIVPGDYIVLKRSISHWHDGFLKRDNYEFCVDSFIGGCALR